MNRTIFFIFFILLVLLGVSSKIYYEIWKSRKSVQKFLMAELKENEIKKKFYINEKKNNEEKKQLAPILSEIKNIEKEKNLVQFLQPHKSINVNKYINSKIFLIKTHINKKIHLLCQDENFYIHLINLDGRIIWKKPFGEKIITKIFAIDFYKNNKTQYFFATKNYLYLIDYKGLRVNSYPLKLDPLQEPKFLNIFDYNKNKNFRIAIANKNGDIYLFDKYKKILKGWNPKSLNSSIVYKPLHIRNNKKDYIIFAKKDGYIAVYKRNGSFYKNFPVNLKEKIKNFCYYKDINKNIILVALTEKDKIYEITLNGKIKAEIHLEKNTYTSYTIIEDKNSLKEYLIIKKTRDSLSIFNRNTKLLIKQMYNNDENKIITPNVKYYSFNNDKIISIQNNKKLFFYKNSTLINIKPIYNSYNDYSFIYNTSSKTLNIFCSNNDKIDIHLLKI